MTENKKWDIIIELARKMGASDYDVLKYRQRGVAHKHRLPIHLEAKKSGVILSDEDFERVRPAL
jgi:hypothetical protein